MKEVGQRKLPLVQVVDDDHYLRLSMRTALEKAGFEVEEAESGRAALAAFEDLRPDLVLLDVIMPELDGFKTCSALRKLPGGEHTPVLMMTSLDDVEWIHRAFEAGANDFITKPINWAMLGYRSMFMLRAGRAFQALRKSEDRLAKAQQIARLGNWDMDLKSGEFNCSLEASFLLGGDMWGELSTEIFFHTVHPEDKEKVRRTIEGAFREEKPFSLHYRVVSPEGAERSIHNQGEFLFDEAGRPDLMMGIVQDVSELKKAEEQIRFLAYYDGLTGLANRLLLKDRLNKALARNRRHGRLSALLFLDLDRFKRINDTLGHHIGDMLLKGIADRISACLRQDDSLARPCEAGGGSCVARLGGDEFIVLLDEIGEPEDAAKVSRRILDAVSEPLRLEGHEVFISTSIGISFFPSDGEDVDSLLKNADTAMYHAKEKGRNNYQFYKESLNATTVERLKLETDLRRALDREEFFLLYQPQLEIVSGRIIGAEALVRWRHPERGLISPATFIPIAEETGMILPLSEWVLRTACRQGKVWQDAGLAIRMAVNLSAHQFERQRIVESVASALGESGLDPRLLEVELTESILMEKGEETISSLQHLKDLGLSIAMDDFGTGYSSLSYLTAFPIDSLKIDRSFVSDILTQSGKVAIVKAIIAMGHSLNLSVIAEGVESGEQLAFMADLGCDEIQGYHFSPPLTPEGFAALQQTMSRVA